jgi:PhzF family phenazine biosynthesis protein
MEGRAVSYVDVFGASALAGNPVAVVHDAGDLDDATMAAFARWTNLSETTFLLPPEDEAADYRLRIFTPGGELPFAGHPTLGSAHAWLQAGGQAADRQCIVQECGAGLVRVRRGEDRLAFAAPPLLRDGPLDEPLLRTLLSAFSLAPERVVAHQWVDNGPGWCALLLDSAASVLAVHPDFQALEGLAVGLVGPHTAGSAVDFEVRAFVPDMGVPEDPVTGSLNAGIAQWLIDSERAPTTFLAGQGRAMGRDGHVFVERDGEATWIGGATQMVVVGTILPFPEETIA